MKNSCAVLDGLTDLSCVTAFPAGSERRSQGCKELCDHSMACCPADHLCPHSDIFNANGFFFRLTSDRTLKFK
jgi:hypothetical protein